MPHVPRTNPAQPPSVWAIDDEHAPLYWFPRDCPRVAAYLSDRSDAAAFRAGFATSAERVHAVESGWLDRIRTTQLYRYEFPADGFEPWPEASGQWIARREVVPIALEIVDDVLARHAARGIDLRIVPSLVPVRDLAVDERWEFRIVRWRNARA